MSRGCVLDAQLIPGSLNNSPRACSLLQTDEETDRKGGGERMRPEKRGGKSWFMCSGEYPEVRLEREMLGPVYEGLTLGPCQGIGTTSSKQFLPIPLI